MIYQLLCAVVIQEQYDPRTLYERLQEQKTLKEEKFAEESRLSNQIKRVDEEEAEYFKILSDEREKLEYERKVKEQLELEEYRQAVEARATPAGVPVAVVNTTKVNTKKPAPTLAKSNSKSVKGALFIKKKKRSHESSDEEEEEKDTKKSKTTPVKGSLSLLSASYGDISSSSSDSE